MLGFANDVKTGARNRFVKSLGVRDGKMLVALGPQRERRALYLRVKIGKSMKRSLIARAHSHDEFSHAGLTEAAP